MINKNNKIELREIQSMELELLKIVVSFCEEHNLRYFVTGGTLLGAVRHEGFIPWDDDIDIDMPDKDYLWLKENFNNLCTRENIRLLAPNNKLEEYNGYIYPFIKIVDTRTFSVSEGIKDDNIGVHIDIFPLNGLPKYKAAIRIFVKFGKIIHKMNQLSNPVYLADKKIKRGDRIKVIIRKKIYTHFISRIFNNRRIRRIQINHAFKYDYDNSARVGNIVWGNGMEHVNDRKSLVDFKVLSFEGIPVNVPGNFHEYLTIFYGDYMKPPPLEEQVSNHINEFYWK